MSIATAQTKNTATSPDNTKPASPSFGRDLVAGLIGAGISIVCVLPPILHFVTGPLGAFFGGMVGGARVAAGVKDATIIGLTIGLILAVAAWLALGLLLLVTISMPPSSLADSPFAGVSGGEVLTIGGAMLVYGTILGGLGALAGGWTKRRK
jgi:hypothetical protein